MDWLPLLKFVHVLAAITALGSNVTYVVWLRTSDPGHVAYAIRAVRRLDRTLANPAYGVLLVTGVLMVATGAPGTIHRTKAEADAAEAAEQ